MAVYRDYQLDCINKSIEFINKPFSKKKGFVVSPTGTGKSHIIAGIADEVDTPIVVLQPSKELLMQNYEKYVALGNKASIFSASLNSKEIGHVTFATIGSIKGSIAELKALGVKLFLIDECHLQCNKDSQVSKFLDMFNNVKIIGLTATPVILVPGMAGSVLKMINRCRKSIWNHVLHIVQIQDIVKAGYWADLVYEKVDVDDDMLRYNTSMSEYTDESIEEMYQVNDLGTMVRKKVEMLTDRKHILIFCPSILTAEQLAASIPGAEVVHSKMKKDERDGVISRFKMGITRVVVNVLVLSVGFDFPELDCVIDTVPTASIARYYQKIGRVTRPHPNKLFALIIDFSSNYDRFGELCDLNFEDVFEEPIAGWGMFAGDRLLTNISPMDDPIFKPKPVIVTVKVAGEPQIIEVITEYVFTFGKYKDKPISQVPKSYLEWMLRDFTFRRRDPLEGIIKNYLNKK